MDSGIIWNASDINLVKGSSFNKPVILKDSKSLDFSKDDLCDLSFLIESITSYRDSNSIPLYLFKCLTS